MRLDTPSLRAFTPVRAPGRSEPPKPPAFLSKPAEQAASSKAVNVTQAAACIPFDGERVEAISAALAAGTYAVDPIRIAARLIAGEHLATDQRP